MANEENGNSGTLAFDNNEIAALKHSIGQAQAFLQRMSDSLDNSSVQTEPHETQLLKQVVSSYKHTSGNQAALSSAAVKLAMLDPGGDDGGGGSGGGGGGGGICATEPGDGTPDIALA